MNAQYKSCIEAVYRCIEACNVCYHACLKEEHMSNMSKCIELDRECAEICTLALHSMQRSSTFAIQILSLCAEICDACGTECKSHNHQHCQDCAQACFRCAEECRKLIS
ncbi:four-helix bundle copper-binding protein [Chengkuizengella axinellae]|uniref:Four-helix bundle copper-binding protein n=1 Tax=Chengkuizengella axinellae TaxID=3064388 RepID=A0ABT9IVK9_9BACL|nr:four-helix bundle copper-binding protein [Chengkuizengella sp. 2205SS18-9]MDP5273391.1 four-helix bundle copper-binding protein [Chengkuizengella sp. 2205SS18-9]